MQQWLGVAAWLLQAFEDQICRGFVGGAGFEVAGHVFVERVTGVLAVYDGGHALKGGVDLRRVGDAVQEPVGDVLAADAQGGAVFHEADVVDVGHFGAADALVDPAHDVAQNALGVVVQLLLDVLWRPRGLHGCGGDGDGQNVAQHLAVAIVFSGFLVGFGIGPHVTFHLLLQLGDVDLVVVQGVQRGAGWAGHPGGVGTGQRVVDFLLEHGFHQIGHGPHAFADLRLAAQAALQADLHVVFLVGGNPRAGFHVCLADHRAGVHGGVHFVAGAV